MFLSPINRKLRGAAAILVRRVTAA